VADLISFTTIWAYPTYCREVKYIDTTYPSAVGVLEEEEEKNNIAVDNQGPTK